MITYTEYSKYAADVLAYCNGNHDLALAHCQHIMDTNKPHTRVHKIANAAKKHLADQHQRQQETAQRQRQAAIDERNQKRFDLALKLLRSANHAAIADILEEIDYYILPDHHLTLARIITRALDNQLLVYKDIYLSDKQVISEMNNLARASEFFYNLAHSK